MGTLPLSCRFFFLTSGHEGAPAGVAEGPPALSEQLPARHDLEGGSNTGANLLSLVQPPAVLPKATTEGMNLAPNSWFVNSTSRAKCLQLFRSESGQNNFFWRQNGKCV
ncbi:hypothetical protein Y1Q_0013643 [Alligator mississippiensis]|uniref:Uncharacterized protein n=1 Tax=Alligator mississippiensis TaxID=8496 RepID=A0A151P3J3_ALLMI|nr:hypothetical protein Y1Q_0013643 [Alligator mississippiensis]